MKWKADNIYLDAIRFTFIDKSIILALKSVAIFFFLSLIVTIDFTEWTKIKCTQQRWRRRRWQCLRPRIMYNVTSTPTLISLCVIEKLENAFAFHNVWNAIPKQIKSKCQHFLANIIRQWKRSINWLTLIYRTHVRANVLTYDYYAFCSGLLLLFCIVLLLTNISVDWALANYLVGTFFLSLHDNLRFEF